ncbi:formate dehydrogenase accessory sulfurtransferase FdhD [Evansella sp. LMS18]|uniref:formate dehydrogenase accessory sulfurtransferase FdhD n=1 Tax=Evansella sp. LMS18 TaxID=2924033 RepID=UPI0020CFF69D|nr:formate dehydrogenase accessory sulfurtransferase FdhD [Evansella sp. LMS18]UTR11481.1 formate dehydrogenase accessory sulfurtransferase FdhD [Evansella sp. LMS18]
MRTCCPEEYPVTLIVEGNEIGTYQLTKADLEDWAYGHLFTEGIINKAGEVQKLKIADNRIYVSLTDETLLRKVLKKKKHVTAGCGNGVTFFSMTDVKRFPKIHTTQVLPLSYMLKKRHEFAKASPMYNESGGMHGACIVLENGEIFVREDIGRHNAVDKIIGYAIREDLDASKLILITTGRISYEMLSKSARFGFGIVGSRTAATKQAVQLAKFLGIEVVGYIRGKMTVVYTNHGKIYNDLKTVTTAGS